MKIIGRLAKQGEIVAELAEDIDTDAYHQNLFH